MDINEEPTEEEGAEEETSLRDDIEAAIVTEGGEGDETEATTEGEATEETDGEKPAGEKPADDPANIGDAEGKPTPEGINAPLGFTPEAREEWKNVPDVVKAQIQVRESQIVEAMANTGEYRRTHDALTGLAQSYAPILAAEGAESPMAAVEGLFRTVAELRVGTPQQTAQKMADLIGHYGIDVSMLDKALSGQSAPTAEQTAMEKMFDAKMKPFNDMMAGQQANSAAQQEAGRVAVNTELATFAETAEFLGDVRNDMADLIELASKQGRIMTFKEAYDKSCALNPEISAVLEKRAADAAILAGHKLREGKNNASSSMRSNSAAIAAASGDDSLRGTISRLWDDATE